MTRKRSFAIKMTKYGRLDHSKPSSDDRHAKRGEAIERFLTLDLEKHRLRDSILRVSHERYEEKGEEDKMLLAQRAGRCQ